MKDNVTPIFSHLNVPTIEARPEHIEASAEELRAFAPVQDFLLLRVEDIFASAGLVAPESISPETAAKLKQGTVMRSGPEAGIAEGTKVQWRSNAFVDNVKVGPELMLCIRSRDLLAVLS